MSDEQLKAFPEKLKVDPSLQDKLKAATDSDAVVAIANDAGFMISAEDLNKAELNLSEEELENVSGGGFWGGQGDSIHPHCANANPNAGMCLATPHPTAAIPKA